MKLKKTLILFSILFILFLCVGTAQAQNINSTSDSAQISADEKTFDAIQNGIDESNESDVIVLSGVYAGDGKAISVNKAVTIKGDGDGARLDANSKSGIFEIKCDNVTLENLILAYGKNSDYGGAIYNAANNLKIINCRFIGCEASYGGAVYSTGSNVSVTGSQFTSNIAHYTGGALELDGADNYVDGCNFKLNIGYHVGGAVAWVGDNGILSNSVFSNSKNNLDKASQFGGAVVWLGDNGKLIKSSFFNNYAKRYGSAVYWSGYNGSFNYCILKDNDYNSVPVYFGNPDFAGYNYWGLNLNSTQFTENNLVYYADSFCLAQNWVNIQLENNTLNFTLNDGTNLAEYLPDYETEYDGVNMLISHNFCKIKKSVTLTCSNMNIYTTVDSNKVYYFKVLLKDVDNNPLSSKLQINVNNKKYNVTTDSKGIANFKLNLKVPDSYKISVAFSGDDDYNVFSKTVKITVKKQKTSLTVKTKTLKVKSKSKFVKISLKNQFKKAISKKTVYLTINKKTYKTKTDSKGIASFKVNLKTKSNYKFTAKFKGDKYYKSVSKKGYVKVK